MTLKTFFPIHKKITNDNGLFFFTHSFFRFFSSLFGSSGPFGSFGFFGRSGFSRFSSSFLFFIACCFFVPHVSLAQSLSITEVFFDGTNERVEITNTSAIDYVGPITLSGVRTNNASRSVNQVTIPGNTSYVFIDDDSIVQQTTNTMITQPKFSLSDTKPLSIQLMLSGQVYDSFAVSAPLVAQINNTQTSFERFNNTIQATTQTRIANIVSGYIANPGFRQQLPLGSSGSMATGSTTGLGSGINSGSNSGASTGLNTGYNTGLTLGSGNTNTTGILMTGNTTITTGTSTTGVLLTGGQITGVVASGPCPTGSGAFLTEVAKGSLFPDYIEFLLIQSNNFLIISGSLLTHPVTIPTATLLPHQRYLITHTQPHTFHHAHNIIHLPFTLHDTGNLILYDDNNNVLDHIHIAHPTALTGQSYYPSVSPGCVRSFADVSSHSPGFAKDFLPYLQTQIQTHTNTVTVTNTQTVYITGSSCPTTGNAANTSGTTTHNHSLSGVAIAITMIDYNPPGSDTNNERLGLTLTGSHPSFVLDSPRKLRYDNKTYTFAQQTLIHGQQHVIVDNFRFVNSRPVCLELMYHTTLVTTACYDPQIHESPRPQRKPSQNSSSSSNGQNGQSSQNGHNTSTTNTSSSTGQTASSSQSGQNASDTTAVDYTSLRLSLGAIIYDPPGNDRNNEQITFISHEDEPIDMTALRIRVNNTNKRIDKTIQPHQSLTITKTRGLSNSKPTCVTLIYFDHEYDQHCYDPTQETGDKENILSGAVINSGQIDGQGASSGQILHGEQKNDKFAHSLLNSSISLTSEASLTFSTLPAIEITAVLPNPEGKDKHNEYVRLRLLSGDVPVRLAKPYYLLINKKKKYLDTTLTPHEDYILTGSFSLPNSYACVSLMYDTNELDRLCYTDAQESYIYTKDTPLGQLGQLSQQDQESISHIRITKKGGRLCVTYMSRSLQCTRYSFKISPSTQLRIAKAYIAQLESHIKDNRYTLRRNSPLKTYAILYRNALAKAKKGHTLTRIDTIKIPLQDLDLQYTLQYTNTVEKQLLGFFQAAFIPCMEHTSCDSDYG